MSDIALSLLVAVANSFVKEAVKALAKRIFSRKKEGTAPITSRDGSGNMK